MFLHDWEENGIEEMKENFEITDLELEGCTILLASYSREGWDGKAFVLFEKEGKLFEVNGDHCSCHGLEHQWEPEETTKEALIYRLTEGELGKDNVIDNVFAEELKALLTNLP